MARVKNTKVTRARRKKVLKQAKGYFGHKHIAYRTAREQVRKSQQYAFRDRKQIKRNMRRLWITRINSACHMEDISYSKFMFGLKKANVDINRKMLADFALNDYGQFKAYIDIAKKAIL